LVIKETATGPPPPAAADEAGAAEAAADEATAAAEVAAAAADDVASDVVLELHAARVTESAPVTATAATRRPRVKR
jgi:hypothetical protein